MSVVITEIKPIIVTLCADGFIFEKVSREVNIKSTISHKQLNADIEIKLNNDDLVMLDGPSGQVPDYEHSLCKALIELLEGLKE